MPEARKDFGAWGAPDWKPNVSEGIVEAAVLAEPQDRYYSNLLRLAGRAHGNNRRFRTLVRSGIFRLTGEQGKAVNGSPSPANLVDIPPEAKRYVLDAVEERIAALVKVRDALHGDSLMESSSLAEQNEVVTAPESDIPGSMVIHNIDPV